MGQIHRFLGISILVLALVNAGIGFNFSGNDYANLPYGVVAGIVALLFAGLFFLLLRSQSKRTYKPERHSFVRDYKEDAAGDGGEFEMHDTPFAQMGGAPPERAPRWMDSNMSLRDADARGALEAGGYSDQPDRHVGVKNPMHTSWQAVPGP